MIFCMLYDKQKLIDKKGFAWACNEIKKAALPGSLIFHYLLFISISEVYSG